MDGLIHKKNVSKYHLQWSLIQNVKHVRILISSTIFDNKYKINVEYFFWNYLPFILNINRKVIKGDCEL